MMTELANLSKLQAALRLNRETLMAYVEREHVWPLRGPAVRLRSEVVCSCRAGGHLIRFNE